LKKVFILILFTLLRLNLFAQGYSLSGQIKEIGSEEFIIGASVFISNIDEPTRPLKGTYTNRFGFYSIPKIKEGNYLLIVRSVGYLTYTDTISIKSENKTMNLFLNTQATITDEIRVVATKTAGAIQSISKADVSADFIAKMPTIGGESDILRAMQMLPGVTATSELSSGLNIRGGSSDQTLYLLDGVIVYNPTHLGGFMSTFNTDAVRDVSLIKGAYPAEYGGRLSGILDVKMKEGAKDEYHGKVGISIINAKAEVEGPIGEDASFMIAGRRLYLDLVTMAAAEAQDVEDMPQYYFYDFNAKFNWVINDKNHLFFSGMFGRDVFDVEFGESNKDEGFKIDWGNKVANLRYMHIFSPELFSNFSLIYTNYSFNTAFRMFNGEGEDKGNLVKFGTENGVEDIVLRSTLDWFGLENHKIKAGIEIISHNFNIYTLDDLFLDDLKNALNKKRTPTAQEFGLFIQDEINTAEKIIINPGLRFNYYHSGGYINLEPRIALSHEFMPNNFFRAAVSNSHQPVHLIKRQDMNLPTDVWIPTMDNIRPGKSWQYTLSYETNLFNDYLFSIETYYKTMEDIYEYKDSITIFSSANIENQLTEGQGLAYGLEIFLHKKIGRLQGWLAYTLSQVKYKFDEINLGEEYFPIHHRLHDFKIVLTYEISKGWDIGADWVFQSGQPISMPTGKYYNSNPNDRDYMSINQYYYSEKNSYRMAPYHRLDLNFMRKFKMFGTLNSVFSINIYNVYNRKNPFSIFVDEEWDSQSQKNTTVLRQITLFPIIPTFGLNVEF